MVLNKADIGRRHRGPARRRRGDRPRRPDRHASRADRRPPRRPRAASPPGHDGGRARLVGRRQVDARQRAARRGPAGDGDGPRGRLPGPPHDDASRAVRRCPGGALLIDTPGIRSLEVAGRGRGRRDRVRRHRRAGGATAASATAATAASPGCAVRVALDDGSLSQDRLASHRKLERELAHAERKDGPARPRRAQARVAAHLQVREPAHVAQVRRRPMTTPAMDEIAVPRSPGSPGSALPPLPGPDGLAGMAAANQAGRDQAGILEVITTESMARSYEHHVNCDPDDGHPRRRARGRDRRVCACRVARPGRRHARFHLGLPAPTRGPRARDRGRDARLGRGPHRRGRGEIAGGSALEDAGLDLGRGRGRVGPAGEARLDEGRARLRDGPPDAR